MNDHGMKSATSEDEGLLRLVEVFEWPPIERWLGDKESILAVQETWPTLVVCTPKLVLRDYPQMFKGDPTVLTEVCGLALV